MIRIIKYILIDILKNKMVFFFTFLLAFISWGVFSVEDNETKGVLTMLNLVLLSIPLVSIIFSTIYIYNSSQFIELLLSHPVKRSTIWTALFAGLSLAMVGSFIIGAGIPILVFAPDRVAIILLLAGCFISAVFVALAFWCSILTRDKAKGIGLAIALWLYFAVLFDGLVLFLMFQFSDYPIESAMIGMSMLSPVDMSRIFVLLDLDVSAMMGYTGAVFKGFFGNGWGMTVSAFAMALWIALPFAFSLRLFNNKDL